MSKKRPSKRPTDAAVHRLVKSGLLVVISQSSGYETNGYQANPTLLDAAGSMLLPGAPEAVRTSIANIMRAALTVGNGDR
jgi:hypothetical protein